MKKSSSVKLSLRKLFIAMLAAGPVAILPSPVLATLPTTLTNNTLINVETTPNTIVQINGSGNLTTFGTTANISVSDKSVLVWTKGAFDIDAGETYHFAVPGGSVLNKIGYLANGALQSAKDDITIAGSLTSSGRVVVLANGNITVTSSGTNSINTSGGLVLSTIQETSDFNFTTQGTVSITGNSLGNITLGTATPAVVSSGNLEVISGNTTLAGVTVVNGDLIVRSITANQGIDLGSLSAVTVNGGNLTVVTNNGTITDTNAITVGNTTTLSNGGSAAITLDAANNFNNLAVTTSGGAVVVNDVNSINLATSSLGSTGSLTVTSGGNIVTTGTVTGGNLVLSSAGDASVFFGSSVASFNATTTSGNVVFSGNGSVSLGTITAGGTGTVSITAPSAVTVNGTITASNNVTITGSSVAATATGIVAAPAGVLTVNATAGSVTLGTSNANRYVVTANGGSISQLASTTLTAPLGVSPLGTQSSFNAGTSGSIQLTGSNVLDNSILTLTGGTVSVNNTRPLVIASANTTGALTITTTASQAGNVILGFGSGTASPAITVGGALSVTTNNSTISDDSDLTLRVFGPVSFNTTAGTANPTTGNITISSQNGASGRGSSSMGQVTINAGNASNVEIVETQTLNLGSVTAGNLTVNSTGGSIIFAGALTANSVSANANTGSISQTAPLNLTSTTNNSSFRAAGSGSIVLDNTSNVFGTTGGNVNIVNGNNNVIVANSPFRLGNGTSTANLTVTTVGAGQAITVVQNNATAGVGGNNIVLNAAGPIVVQSTSAIRNLTLNSTDTSASSITTAAGGNLQTNGTLTLMSSGNVLLNGTATGGSLANTNAGIITSGVGMNVTGNIVLANVAGDVTLVNQRNTTVSGNTNANLTVVGGVGPFANTWALNFGNLVVKGNLTANLLNGDLNNSVSGSSGMIGQTSGARLHVENRARFITFNGGNIVLGNNGNSFGRVEAFTGGAVNSATNHAGNVTIVEDSTLKVGNVLTAGNATLTSRFGSIIEDTAAATDISVTGLLTLNAVNGSVLIGGTTNGNTTTGAVANFNVNAPSGAVAIQSSGNITIGATAANSLSVRSGNSITQSGALNIFGLSSFNATNSITLDNSANNFGPLSLTSGTAGQSILVTEAGTLNLRTVTMPGGGNGTFTATSVNGDIIDSGLGNVRPGGLVGAIGSGVVNLVATNGNITIDDPTSDFPTSGGVAFNAKNVTISVLGSGTPATTLVLGAANTTSVATGNLIATSALGNITNAGNLNVAGNAFFQTGAGNISLNQSGNQFGSIRFVGNQINIVEANDTVLTTGSSAIGQAQITSGGNITVQNTGGGAITFGSVVSLGASGSITLPKLIQAANTLSVNAPGTKDLSALSISSDLSGRSPINLGSGTYLPPQP